MATITIRRLDERLKRQLRHRATAHGCSMEEEVRRILRDSLERERPQSFIEIATELFGPEHGIDLPELPRGPMPDPPDFSKE